MVGRDLIRSAEVRQTVSQKMQFDTAANTFRNKYNCLPADCQNPTALGFSGGNGSGGANPDGDDIIYYGGNSQTGYWFWQQLFEANLVPIKPAYVRAGLRFAGDSSPPCPICERFLVTSYGAPNPVVGGWQIVDFQKLPALSCSSFTDVGGIPIRARSFILTTGNVAGQSPAYETLTLQNAYAVDVKLDDGRPLSGSVIAVGSYYYTDTAHSGCSGFLNTDTALSYVWGTNNNTYTVTITSKVDLIMKAGF